MATRFSIVSLFAAQGSRYILDVYTGAAAAYSLRQLKTGVTNCIKVRRDSDNTTQIIGFVNGVIDSSSLTTFVGSGSGFIDTWYDQSGNGRDATQSSTSIQPRIVNLGTIETQNSKAAVRWTAADQVLNIGSFTFAQPTTMFIVAKNDGTNNHHFIDSASANRQLVGVSSGNLVIYSGAVLTFGANSTAFNLHTALFNSTSSFIQRNGAGRVTGDAGTNNESTGILLGAGNGASQGIIGYESEVILYASDQTSNVSAIETNINNYYGIF